MAKFIEVLKNGLTIEGKVCPAGQRVQVRHDFPLVSKKKQAERWGAPRYREITKADFEAIGGVESPYEYTPSGTESAPAPEVTEEAPPAEVNKFAEFDGLNVEGTLQAAAELPEAELAEFLEYERATQARVTVLDALGVPQE